MIAPPTVTVDLEDLRADVDVVLSKLDYLLPTVVQPAPFSATTIMSTPSGQMWMPAAAHAWHNLTGSEAGGAWAELTSWVDWLIDRYRLEDTVPPCWYRHGAMIEELDALRAAWAAAYLNPKAQSSDPLQWHGLLANCLLRIHGWDRYGCTSGTHRDDTRPQVDDRAMEERRAYLQEDIRHHPPATPTAQPNAEEPVEATSATSPQQLADPYPPTGD